MKGIAIEIQPKPLFTVAEHRRMGKDLKRIKMLLCEVQDQIHTKCRDNLELKDMANKIHVSTDSARSDLEQILLDDHPKVKDPMKVYFGDMYRHRPRRKSDD